MTMDSTNDKHSRRLDDIINAVRAITQEVDRFIAGDAQGANHVVRMQIKANLQRKQAAALEALQQAMAGQQELLDQLDSGIQTPQRRATDPKRTKPSLRTVEDIEIATIRRLAGYED